MVTKQESKMAQGIGVLAMLVLHLFNRVGELHFTPLIMVGDLTLVYYIGLLGDMCVPVFSFSAGYAQYLLQETKRDTYSADRLKRILKLLKHFWTIAVIFVLIGLCLPIRDEFLISPLHVLGNLTLIICDMNGAWWYMLTYIFLVLLFPLLGRLSEKMNGLLTILLFGVVYTVGYIFEFHSPIDPGNEIVKWIIRQLVLLARCAFPFMIGTVYCKYDVTGKIKERLTNRVVKGILLTVTPLVLMGAHCVIKSLFIAPVVAVGSLTCFYVWEKPRWFTAVYTYLGNRSNDIWLIHLFFLYNPFKGLVYAARYPVPIFLFMLALSLASSYVIEYVERTLTWLWSKLFRPGVPVKF